MKYRRFFSLRPQTKADIERDVDDELEAHLELRARELMERGEPAARARRTAVERFGDLPGTRRDLVHAAQDRNTRSRRAEWLDGIGQDIGYAWRRARRTPGHTLLSVALLALAIGLTTATFTLVDGAVLRSLPFPQADRLFDLHSQDSVGNDVEVVSLGNWIDWKEQNRTLASSAIYATHRVPVIADGTSARVTAAVTMGSFFATLKPPLLIGRGFTDEEALSGQRLAVVSEGFWRRMLTGDRSLNQVVTVAGRAVTVVGVVRAGYEFPAGTEIWLSSPYRRETGALRNHVNYSAIARLKAGVSLEQAEQDLDAIAARIRRQDPAGIYSHGVIFHPLKKAVVGDYANYLWLLLGAVGFVLLVVCTNLAGINLARGVARKQEMAVRAALGAGRRRLVRQLLLEHLALALLAGAAGIALSWWCVRLVLLRAGALLPRVQEITVDLRVLAFAVVVTLLTGVLTGLLPALQVSAASLQQQMTSAQRGSIAGGRNLPGAVLVGVEVALALLLLTGGGLLIRSYQTLTSRTLGFDPQNLIMAEIALGGSRTAEQSVQYWEELLPKLRNLAGVEAAGAANWVPLGFAGTSFLDIENGMQGGGAGYRAITDDYLRTLGLPLVAGRGFSAGDALGTPRVVIINRRLAQTYFRDSNPIGRRIRARGMESGPAGTPAPWLTIIGITGDLRHWGLAADPTPEMYVSYRQVPFHARAMTAVLRTRVPPETLLNTVRARIREHDPGTPADLGTLQDQLEQSLQARRLIMAVLSGFAAIALLLAALGLYSLISFAVAQRTRELAVRAALGARRANLLQMVFGNAMLVVGLGALAGLAAAAGLTRFLNALLVGVQPLDPLTLIAVTLALLLAAAVAVLWPALRAARLDPLIALRSD